MDGLANKLHTQIRNKILRKIIGVKISVNVETRVNLKSVSCQGQSCVFSIVCEVVSYNNELMPFYNKFSYRRDTKFLVSRDTRQCRTTLTIVARHKAEILVSREFVLRKKNYFKNQTSIINKKLVGDQIQIQTI